MSPLWWSVPLPAAFLALAGLAATGVLGHDAELVPRSLGPEGVAGITGGLFLASLFYTVDAGRRRSCPACGAWWARVTQSSAPTTTSTDKSRFTAGGWTRESEDVSRVTCLLVCRRCAHEFTRSFSSTRRRRP